MSSEDVVWLQLDKPLTVEAIQQILGQLTTLRYQPNESHFGNLENAASKKEFISFAEITDYALGFGTEVPAEITRVMLLLLADFTAKHPVSNGAAIINRILEFYQFDVFPQVFTRGLFASPTAHALLPIFSQSKVYYQGYLLNAADVHDIFSWQPVIWPADFPASVQHISYLDLAVLVYTFIQFKQIRQYTQTLFAGNDYFLSAEEFFEEQTNNLATQIQAAIALPEEHTTYVSGLGMQLNKLLAKFGEHISDYFAEQGSSSPDYLIIKENFKINLNLLPGLLKPLTQKNLVLIEENSQPTLNSSFVFGSAPLMQTYAILKNLEQTVALATLLQLKPSQKKPESENFKNSSLANTYLNQVISVLKEANFADIIRQTVTFMYATCKTYNLVA
ncbi:hypothetical protein HUW51_20600 [Adhaeribacter swui]|uniref:Aromatic amino acid lyase n=1 Tax=Adhaeribacter swui TaxID=2086471 RepID=A0A7G7GCW8_9BACT|nr:aromatic amino acid lyase [Adhaeribacter swui]QNF35002.1 hypothetical protein HUW51_20600 [Adhaeribacter swui]